MVIHCTVWNTESWLSIKCKHQLNTKGGVYAFMRPHPSVFKLDLSNHRWRNETLPYKSRSICLTLNKNALFPVTQIVLIGSWSQLPVTAAKWCNSRETSREDEGVFFFLSLFWNWNICWQTSRWLLWESCFPLLSQHSSGNCVTHGNYVERV